MAVTADDPVTFRPDRLAWILTWTQYAYVVWFAACVVMVFARADHFAGHVYVPAQNDRYTADIDIWTGWARSFRSPMMFTALAGPTLAAFAVVTSAALLIPARVRASRRLAYALVISAVLALLTVIAALTPAGTSIIGWILD